MKNCDETIYVEASEKIEIFNRRFSSVPMNYEFSVKPLGSQPLSGSLEIHSKQLVFTSPVKTIDLKPFNAVSASLWDTFMTIYVIAGCDMEITVPKRNVTSMKWIIVLVTVLVVVAVTMLMLS